MQEDSREYAPPTLNEGRALPYPQIWSTAIGKRYSHQHSLASRASPQTPTGGLISPTDTLLYKGTRSLWHVGGHQNGKEKGG